MKRFKQEAINWEGENTLIIECFRVKVEFESNGTLRFYFFNPTELGDVCIEIKEPIFQAEVWHEKDLSRNPSFVFYNNYINPSKRHNGEEER